MADIEASVQIDRPPAAVFDFISDPRQVPRWQRLYESAELVGGATLRLGSAFATGAAAAMRSSTASRRSSRPFASISPNTIVRAC